MTGAAKVAYRGKTRYELEEMPTGDICVTRINSDGAVNMFFPCELLFDFARDKVIAEFARMLKASVK